MTDIRVAVTDLVRFCHRSGDIDHRFTPSPTGAEGIAGHQHLYRQRAGSYRREYALEYVHRAGDLRLTLRGRADGYDPEQGLVEEIKTCRTDPGAIPPAVAALHLAQARLYAAIIAHEEQRTQLTVQTTWLNIDTLATAEYSENCDALSLATFLDDTLAQFSDWLQRIANLRGARDASLAQMDFPWGEFRRGQRDIAELTYKCIDQGGQLLLEAPTGIGKTAAVVFPALKALATGKHDKVAFITAKTIGRRAAEDALATCTDGGYRGTSLSLTARDTICLSPGSACHGDDCPYAQGYYDKLPAAMRAAMKRGTLRRADLEELAREHAVCPYELALDLLPWVDMVIADAHYAYSLSAMLGHAMDSGSQQWTLLVDEAHNLPGRARRMYGAALAKRQLMNAKKEVPQDLARALERCNRQMLALNSQEWDTPDFHSGAEIPAALLRSLEQLVGETAAQMAADPTFLPRHPSFMEFYFEVLQFLRVAENWGEDYRIERHRSQRSQSLTLVLNCLDPARLLGAAQERAHAVVAFSATLSPMDWSRAALGLQEDAVCSRSESPFAADQLKVTLATDLDTRYRQREATLPALASRLARWLDETPGNCIVYFPSYRYMNDALDLMPDNGSRHRWQQQPQLPEEARAELLALFEQREDVAAFCILGGIFGEGIDLPGDALRSVAVVGVGMPQVNRDTRQLQDYFEARSGAGFDYTFLYPGMQKVDQALGRVVRTLSDEGSALLLDTRYAEQRYRELLPPWWEYRVE
ncbi:MAG: ATP-dependent DNA helicase [Halioglobus sp.]|nr:ATP-dependent DNA helicase [Halioglobus sp.]